MVKKIKGHFEEENKDKKRKNHGNPRERTICRPTFHLSNLTITSTRTCIFAARLKQLHEEKSSLKRQLMYFQQSIKTHLFFSQRLLNTRESTEQKHKALTTENFRQNIKYHMHCLQWQLQQKASYRSSPAFPASPEKIRHQQ